MHVLLYVYRCTFIDSIFILNLSWQLKINIPYYNITYVNPRKNYIYIYILYIIMYNYI